MKLTGTKIGILILALTFVMSLGGFVYAMGMGSGTGTGMGMGPGMGGKAMSAKQLANRFSGFGTVTAVDTVASTITVELTMASRLLSANVGTPFTFQVSAKAWIGPMSMGGMMGQSAAAGHGMTAATRSRLTLASINVGDQVSLMGSLNSTSNEYTVDRLFTWLY